ncbi:YkgJ family cysteine cluster protein [Candidatus Micrarchaeota archaeon]|nr:YkgJ family cysteine cluster protein [Candidatus Micrarchaeota archaeon]MBU1166392.1 YkgJ family cysteine cluster protein [Candidatus Micrarchaeota archaeon]MBU1887176.1 YkgJ family cysteine cluster protein [Candidatus Micrarchaeota archaeon]
MKLPSILHGGRMKNSPMSCIRCGNCCTRFAVCVTPSDIERVSKFTGKKPFEFVGVLEEAPQRERTEPAILINNTYSVLVLRRKPDNKCKFYGGSGCTIYSARPMLCRCYPFTFGNGEGIIEVCSRACNVVWEPKDPELSNYKTNCGTYKVELRAYKELATKWNSNGGGTFSEFLEFISRSQNKSI